MALLLDETVDLRANYRAEEQGDKELCLGLLVGSERKSEQLRWWVQRCLKQTLESNFGDHFLIGRDRETTVHYMKHALSRSLVILGIVKYALQIQRNYLKFTKESWKERNKPELRGTR